MRKSYSKIRHMQESNIILEQRKFGLLNEQNSTKTILIKVATEGWGKIPQSLVTAQDDTPKCSYSGYYLSFKYNGVFYDIDMNGAAPGIRGGDSDSFEEMHKLLTEGIDTGLFQCATNESLVTPMESGGKKYLSLINGQLATEVLTNVKPGDKTVWGGFYSQTNKNNSFILVNNGGTWVYGKLTHRLAS